MTVSSLESESVLERTRDGAWDAVIDMERRSGQWLLGYAIRLGVEPACAADLVQEALIRLWRELGRGAPIESPEAWTYRTLSHLAMDEHRLGRRIARLVARLGGRDAPPSMESQATDHIAVWAAVDRLPIRQRQAIYLRYHADLAFDEVALVMGITSSAARSHATQAIAALRAQLADPRGDR